MLKFSQDLPFVPALHEQDKYALILPNFLYASQRYWSIHTRS